LAKNSTVDEHTHLDEKNVITQAKLGVLMRERLRLPLEGKLSAKRTDEVECSNQCNYQSRLILNTSSGAVRHLLLKEEALKYC
jgi:hypothetical protein